MTGENETVSGENKKMVWTAPQMTVLNAGATAGGANMTTTEGTGGPGGGYFPS